MYHRDQSPNRGQQNRDQFNRSADRQTASLAGVVVVLLLLVGGLFLVQQLRVSVAAQDCLMAGRHNCDALVQ